MNEPQTITTDHLRTLLAADSGSARLGLIGGRVEVIAADQLDTDDFRGSLEVVSRDDLVARVGSDPSDETLSDEAGALTTAVRQLGG
jgi:hypothetical protein|nr:hypothetical protein [Aeromicrobium sp.]